MNPSCHNTVAVLALLICISLTGCAQYATPGRGADLSAVGVQSLTDATIQQSLDRKPLATFPAAIAAVRIQAPCYRSGTAGSFGTGRYSVVTTRDVEKPEHFERLAKMPMVTGIAPINRLLLPERFQSDLELRQAAAALHADMLLIYTLDTVFYGEQMAAPLNVITLGLSPTKKAHVVTTASAVLMDTRNGYIYGVAEASALENQLASAWTTTAAIDQARRRAETQAFASLVTEMEQAWTGVVNQYAVNR